MLYKLVRDEQTGKWVVDDIYVKQRKKDVTAAKSVTAQMDLLLSVREFLAAWENGDRDEIIAVSTSELGELLKRMPPTQLAQLTKLMTEGHEKKVRNSPKAQLDEDVAIVQLPRDRGKIVLTFQLIGETWKVSDAAIESRDEKNHISSLVKYMTVMKASLDFLDAYAASDRSALAEVCTKTLFKKSLAHADYSAIPLPTSSTLSENCDLTLNQGGADFVINGENEVVRIVLDRHDDEDLDTMTEYVVEEVTVYELDTTQNIRISSAFNAQAIVKIFTESLGQRELDMLKRTSTADFGKRVWNYLDEKTLGDMPLTEFEGRQVRVIDTAFQGPVTEVTADIGGQVMTFVLRDRLGDVRVDDVLSIVPGRPTSLKETLEVLLPISQFVQAVANSDFDRMQRISSTGFNRLVWNQMDHVPALCNVATKHIRVPLTRIENGSGQILVTLGDERWGSRVLLVKQGEHLVIDEMLLIAGVQPNERIKLKEAIRNRMADGSLYAAASRAKPAIPAARRAPLDLSQPNLAAPRTIMPRTLSPVSPVRAMPVTEPESPVIEPSDDAFTTPAFKSASFHAANAGVYQKLQRPILQPRSLPRASANMPASVK